MFPESKLVMWITPLENVDGNDVCFTLITGYLPNSVIRKIIKPPADTLATSHNTEEPWRLKPVRNVYYYKCFWDKFYVILDLHQ